MNNQKVDPTTSASNLDDPVITRAKLQEECQNDEPYQLLLQTIINGYPKIKNEFHSSFIRSFRDVRHRLSLSNKVILMDGQIVIPGNLKKKHILRTLHSAHQGADSMKRRANMSVYWSGLNNDIRNMRYTCHTCNEIAPQQQKEPLILTPPPQHPFQQICADYFEITAHHYLLVVDRFSGWLNFYYYPPHKTIVDTLISTCQTIFISYGIPEEMSIDRGLQFISQSF